MLVQNLSKEEANVCKLWDSVLIVLSSHNKYMQRGSANSTNYTRQIFKKKRKKKERKEKIYSCPKHQLNPTLSVRLSCGSPVRAPSPLAKHLWDILVKFMFFLLGMVKALHHVPHREVLSLLQ